MATPTSGPGEISGASASGLNFYGWRIVFASFVMMTISSGLCFYNLPVFLRALIEQNGMSVKIVSFATAFYFVAGGVIGIAVARLIERYDPRFTFVGGAIMGGCGLVLVGQATEEWHVFAAYAVLAVGFSASSFVPATTIVSRWFVKKRSIAMALASSGLSVGGIAVTPFSVWLIDQYGLMQTTWYLGAMYIGTVIPVSLLWIRRDPASMGLRPDGDVLEAGEAVPPLLGATFHEARQTRFFWFVTFTFLFGLMTQVGGIAHMFKLVADRANTETAALAMSCLAGASMTGRLIGGWILTKVSMRHFTIGILFNQGISLILLGFADQPLMMLGFVVLFGATVGNILMLLPLLLGEAFGGRDYGRIYANSQMMCTFGVAAGPAVIGLLYSWSGDYLWAYCITGMMALVGLVTFLIAGPLPDGEKSSPEEYTA